MFVDPKIDYLISLFCKNVYISNYLVPKNDVEWVITPRGQLKISWLKKVANYDEDNKVLLTLSDLSRNNSVRNVTGTANEVSGGGLQIGGNYSLELEDLSAGDKFGPVHFEACKCRH